MQGEPQRLDRAHARLKSRPDHDPADNALCAEKQSHARKDRKPPPLHGAARGKPEEAGDVDEPDEAAKLAVRPLPPVDGFERFEAHPLVQEIVLRALAVKVERRLPVRSPNGGNAPARKFHSVIESPDSVSRVAPPTSTIAKTRRMRKSSQRRTPRRSWCAAPAAAGSDES